MARPKKTDTEKKERHISIRVTPTEYKEIELQAEINGLSVSDLVRRRALKRRVVPVIDLHMINELRKLGGLAKHIYTESRGLYSKDTAAILQELNHAIRRVGNTKEVHVNDSENN